MSFAIFSKLLSSTRNESSCSRKSGEFFASINRPIRARRSRLRRERRRASLNRPRMGETPSDPSRSPEESHEKAPMSGGCICRECCGEASPPRPSRRSPARIFESSCLLGSWRLARAEKTERKGEPPFEAHLIYIVCPMANRISVSAPFTFRAHRLRHRVRPNPVTFRTEHHTTTSCPTRIQGVWVATVGNIDWPSSRALDAGTAARAARNPRSRRGAATERDHPAGAAGGRRALCVAVRAVVGIPDRTNGQSARSVVRSARVRGERSASARARAARVVQSVPRASSAGNRAPSATTSASPIRSWSNATAASSGWIPASRRCATNDSRCARRRASATTSMAFTSTTTSIPTWRTIGAATVIDFPDAPSWRATRLGGTLSRDDWRRENVDSLIHQVYVGSTR